MKLALKLFLIILIWICAWTPAAFVATFQLFGYGEHVSHGLSIVALLTIKTSSIINMFVYGLRLVHSNWDNLVKPMRFYEICRLPKFKSHIFSLLGLNKRKVEKRINSNWVSGLKDYSTISNKIRISFDSKLRLCEECVRLTMKKFSQIFASLYKFQAYFYE